MLQLLSKGNKVNNEIAEAVFKEIYLNNFEKIKYYAFRYLKDEAQAKCIAQDVFLALWEKIDDIYDRDEILPLLFIIAKYKCLNVMRRESRNRVFKDYRRKHDEDSITYVALSEPASTSLYSKDVERLYVNALNAMPLLVKETFLFSRKEEMKYSEIALKQNISIKTVEYRISYAFKILRKYLKDYLALILF